MLLADLVTASNDVSRTLGRHEKIARLAALLRRYDTAEVAIAIPCLSGALTQGKIGVGGRSRYIRDDPSGVCENDQVGATGPVKQSD